MVFLLFSCMVKISWQINEQVTIKRTYLNWFLSADCGRGRGKECQNGGVCTYVSTGKDEVAVSSNLMTRCECASGFTGDFCEEAEADAQVAGMAIFTTFKRKCTNFFIKTNSLDCYTNFEKFQSNNCEIFSFSNVN